MLVEVRMSRLLLGAVVLCGLASGDNTAGAQEKKKGWLDRAGEVARGAGERARGGLERATERAREKVEGAKEKVREEWRERAHSSPSCGRTIHVGATCVSCGTKRLTERAREQIQKYEHPCTGCGRVIALGSRCGRCGWAPIRAKTAQRTARLRPRVEAVTRQYGPRVRRFVTDPDKQRRAIEALAVGYALYQEQATVKRQLTEAAILKLGNGIVVPTSKYGRVTLLELSTRALMERAPYLRRTDIEKEPAKVLTHLIYKDTNYFLSEAKLVVRNGQPLSMTEALAASNPALAQDALVCLEAMDAYETLTDEMVTMGDVQLAARGLEVAMGALPKG
ncbi:MAG: hypothetical protein L0216_04320 [Planctomycetales bacterium]|nr:hypothetical protein [Planctomycetales bacterium]